MAGKRGRLSRSGEFDRVYREGDSRANRFLVFYSFPRSQGADPRLGISVGRKIGRAVVRNKVKRALREAFWAHADRLPAAHDFVIVARPGIEGLLDRDGPAGVESSLSELLADGAPAEQPGDAAEPEERLT